jgi:hypothetical protein
VGVEKGTGVWSVQRKGDGEWTDVGRVRVPLNN